MSSCHNLFHFLLQRFSQFLQLTNSITMLSVVHLFVVVSSIKSNSLICLLFFSTQVDPLVTRRTEARLVPGLLGVRVHPPTPVAPALTRGPAGPALLHPARLGQAPSRAAQSPCIQSVTQPEGGHGRTTVSEP